jgi:hypothetical protein
MEVIMGWLRTALAITIGSSSLFTLTNVAQASEFYIGEPVEKNGLEIGAFYLKAIEMEPQPPIPPEDNTIHLECDVSATENNEQGFPAGAWVPYLTCSYNIEKVGSDWQHTGTMLPMVAQDGPHYANNVPVDGPGTYRLTYYLSPPSAQGFFRHADEETGVKSWWEPFTVQWTFEYPSQPVE